MHKRYVTAGLLLSALLLTLSACAPKGGGGTPAPTVIPTESDENASPHPLVWTDQVAEQTFSADDGAVLLTARFVLPGIEDKTADPAWTIVSAYYQKEGEAYLEQAKEDAGWAGGDYEVAQAMDYDFTPYTQSSNYRVVRQTETLVSIVRTLDMTYGDAESGHFQFSEQFHLYNGQRLTFSDFFSDASEARARILTAVGEAAPDVDGATLSDKFRDENFYLTDDGFVFYYQPGDIAPQASGVQEFPLSYHDLEDLMTQGW